MDKSWSLWAKGGKKSMDLLNDDVAIATPHAEESTPAAVVERTTKNFYEYTLPELEQILTGLGKEKFRAKQVFKWVYEQRVENYDDMSNVSKAFRAELPAIFHFELPRTVAELKSKDGTRKWLFDIGGANVCPPETGAAWNFGTAADRSGMARSCY